VNVKTARTTIRNRVLPTVAAVVFLSAVANPAGTANADDDLPRGKLSDCGWQDLKTWGWHDRAESVHNRSGSDVRYEGHFDFGDPANGHTFDDENLFENKNGVAMANISPPNSADHVYRFRPC
jgi:hypothetical protein